MEKFKPTPEEIKSFDAFKKDKDTAKARGLDDVAAANEAGDRMHEREDENLVKELENTGVGEELSDEEKEAAASDVEELAKAVGEK